MKRHIQTAIVFCIFCIGSMVACFAQTATAVAPAKVGINQRISYTVKLDQHPSKITATNFGTFTHVGGPSQSSSTSIQIVNGQQSASYTYSYTYTLQPTKVGKQTIPGVSFLVDGKVVTSNSVIVEVTQEDQQVRRRQRQPFVDPFEEFFGNSARQQRQAIDFDSEIFLKSQVSKTNPYVGEEVVITYKLYYSNIYQFQVTGNEFPQQQNLWTYQLGNPNASPQPTTTTLNGKRYNVVEVYKTAVYPQKAGTLTVTPLELEGVVTVPSGWFGADQQRKKLKSGEITLNVKELPAGKPANFSGLVGKFTMTSSLTKAELKTNDATDLVVKISGSGNLQMAESPAINFPTDFDVSDPAVNDKIQTGGNSVNGSRSFDYVIIPRTVGNFTIPGCEFCYFDPQSKTYKTLTTEPYEVKVEKGEDDNSVSSSYQKGIQMLDKDIRYIQTDASQFNKKSKVFFGTSLYFLLLFLPLLLFILFIFIWRKSIKNRENVMELRNKRATKVARRSLKKAKKLLAENKESEFYVEISRALWGYMSDKYKIPLAELSIETVRNRLTDKGLTQEDIENFIHTLNECEFARFAPNNSGETMNNLYNLSLDFITQIEKK